MSELDVNRKGKDRRQESDRRQIKGAGPGGDERRNVNRRASVGDRRLDNNILFTTFFLDKTLFGLPVEAVQEILLPQPLTPVPLADDHYEGLINLRGQIVPAISLRKRMGLPQWEEEFHFNLVAHGKGELYSLIVDNVGDVLEVYQSSMEPPPANLDPQLAPFVMGVCKLRGQLLIILDVEKLT